MDSEGAMHVEANGFINLQLSWDGAEKKRVVSPPHYVVMWSSREKSGKMRLGERGELLQSYNITLHITLY